MAVNVSDVQDHHTLSNRIESIPPKLNLRPIKKHPYLNTQPLNTPPLPKPMHFHQLSDQTGQTTHQFNNHYHQASTISLPNQSNTRFDFSKPQPQIPNFQFNQQELNYQQINKQQPIYYNGNIEQYETTFTYNDLDKRNDNLFYLNNQQQIYMNQPMINQQLENYQSKHSIKPLSDSQINMNGQINNGNHKLDQSKSNHNDHVIENQNLTQLTYHGLPMKFVKALKKLFDIFDTSKTGLVRLIDIETRINEEEFDEELDRQDLLIENLRKVTSPNGFLNFSNFCAAINICLLKNQLAKSKQQDNKIKLKNDRNDSYLRAQNLDRTLDDNRNIYPSTNPFSNQQKSYKQKSSLNSSFTSTNSGSSSSNSSSKLHKDLVKLHLKSNGQQQQSLYQNKFRPSSVPVDETDYYKDSNNINRPSLINKKLDIKAKSMGNLKEQIYVNKLRQCHSESRIQNNVLSPQEIMHKLIEWRNNLLERKLKTMNNSIISNQQPTLSFPPAMPILNTPVINQTNYQLNHQVNQSLYSVVNKKTINYRKREEARRHTVNSLHSLNTMKKLTNMQREKTLLQDGIAIIERAKQYYQRQIAIVQNQIDSLNQYTKNGNNFFLNQLNSDYNLEQHVDKLNRLGQINKNLVILMDDHLFSMNDNQLNSRTINNEIEIQKQNLTILKLKEQVKILNDELTRKNNLILNLENSNPFLRIN